MQSPLKLPPAVRLVSAQAEPATVEAIYEATGVPLVDELMSLRTLDAAVQYSVQLAAAALAAALLGMLVLRLVDRVAGRRIAASGSDFNILAAAAASAFRPCQVLLPYYAVTYIVTVGAALGQVAAVKMKRDFAALCSGRGEQVLAALKFFTQLVQDTSELLLIIFAAWAFIDFKNRVLRWVAASVLLASDANAENTAVTLLRPLSGVINLVILLAAATTALGAYGINLGPIVASVGGLGVVVGLASQKLLMNAASAIALFTAKPFVVGDEIQLMSGAAPIVSGTVVQIEPMRTVVHAEDGGLVYVNNADVMGYVIKNVTAGRALQAANSAVTTPGQAAEMAAELIEG